jgi:uncharacterized protein
VNFFKAKKYILDRLKDELSPSLSYHGFHHTIDVFESAIEIAKTEGVTDAKDLILIKTAALYHDCGFVNTYKGHEAAGCDIARSILPTFQYSDTDIELICDMIMATKIPQNPKSKFEEIIADADLDYLGRNDFDQISSSLFKELNVYANLSDENEWNKLQVSFLESHTYFTNFAKQNREEKKQQNLLKIKSLLQ